MSGDSEVPIGERSGAHAPPPQQTLRLKPLPGAVGRYEVVHDIFFVTTKKPRWIHRLFCRLLLGWKWTDDR